jgi:hypothetical protein
MAITKGDEPKVMTSGQDESSDVRRKRQHQKPVMRPCRIARSHDVVALELLDTPFAPISDE